MDNSKINVRTIPTGVHIRDATSDEGETPGMQIEGYAALFGEASRPMPFYEVIEPGALDGIDLSDVQLLFGHDFNNILARADSGTLTVKVDDKGLFFVATLPDTQLGRDTYTNIKNGNVKGCSFRYTDADGGVGWGEDDDGNTVRHVYQIADVFELSLTSLPSYDETSVAVKRSYDDYLKGEKDVKDDQTEEKNTDDAQSTGSDSETDKNKKKDEQASAEDDSAASEDESQQSNDNGDDTQQVDDGDATDDTEETGEDVPLDQKKGEKKKMSKNLTENAAANAEVRSFEQYVKSHGHARDGVRMIDNEAVIPKQIMTAVEEAPDPNDLYQHVNRKIVNTPSGTLPVIPRAGAGLTTKEELAENPELAFQYKSVDYKVISRAGVLPISQEMIDDDPNSIASTVSEFINQSTRLTEQRLIGAALLKFKRNKTIASADDLKTAVNVDIKAGYKTAFVLSQSAYNIVDLWKDNEGRYLLQPSITSASGQTLLGKPVYFVEDEILQAGTTDTPDTAIRGWVGDLKAGVLDAVRKETTVKWTDNDIWGEKLSAYLRSDVVVAIDEAGELLNFSPKA
ncbi:phage major capsid protein [Lacticaseibacillus hulanensis]|uniref:phage major capsid protein n=1 Tax=Lacticaseibacillus hulanensis TaxID=2493111 RepID=UPI000FD8D256|nr:phage major capsid protein [Lacticaseibacillus hulanensis]